MLSVNISVPKITVKSCDFYSPNIKSCKFVSKMLSVYFLRYTFYTYIFVCQIGLTDYIELVNWQHLKLILLIMYLSVYLIVEFHCRIKKAYNWSTAIHWTDWEHSRKIINAKIKTDSIWKGCLIFVHLELIKLYLYLMRSFFVVLQKKLTALQWQFWLTGWTELVCEFSCDFWNIAASSLLLSIASQKCIKIEYC